MKKKAKRKRAKNMAELTKGHEQFIKGKEVNKNGLKLFDNNIKKASKND